MSTTDTRETGGGPGAGGEGESERGRHPIGVAAERTGLSPHVLRMWERRYGLVDPDRSDGGRRLYSDAEIERLRLLHRLTLGGRSIGQVADLDDRELVELLREDERARARAPAEPEEGAPGPAAQEAVERCLAAAAELDEDGLQRSLRRAAALMGVPRFLEEVAAPLLRILGEAWHGGDATPAEEHMTSAVLRRVLESAMVSMEVAEGAPVVVVATPRGERHEIGALMAAAAIRAAGWRVRYLGADLPAAEISDAAARTGARAVALSSVYPAEGDGLVAEVSALREGLDSGVTLLVGGAGAAERAGELEEVGAVVLSDLDALRTALPGVGP